MAGNEGIVHEWNWKLYFNKQNLDYGKQDARLGRLNDFEIDPAGKWAKGKTIAGFLVEVKNVPTTYDELLHYPSWNTLDTSKYSSGPKSYKNYYACSCSIGSNGGRCRHLASLLYRWELTRGMIAVTETMEEHAERIRAEQEKQAKLDRIKREQEEKLAKQARVTPVIDYVLGQVPLAPKGLFFPPDSILRKAGLLTDEYETDVAERLLAGEETPQLDVEPAFAPGKAQMLDVIACYGDNKVHITLSQESFVGLSCSCGRSHPSRVSYWYPQEQRQGRMCGHALAVWFLLRKRIIRDNPGDETDYNGRQFLSLMAGERATQEPQVLNEAPVRQKRACIALVPRITRSSDRESLMLGFDIGRVGERSYSVKTLQKLVKAVDGEEIYAATKAVSLDFSAETFTEEAAAWFQLIASRVRSVQSVNAKLNASRFYSSGTTLSAGAGIPLEESDLDVVYDMAEDGEIQYQYGSRADVCTVRVGAANPRMEIRLRPMRSGNALTGISVTGAMPRLLRGSLHQYILDKTCFGRVLDDETSFLSALQAISDGSGSFRCTIGEKKLAEFYYRVLPMLQSNPQITVVDEVGALIEAYVPPEPQFTFYLDLDDVISCETTVGYEGNTFRMDAALSPNAIQRRDLDQERRVLSIVRRFFPKDDPRTGRFVAAPDEDYLAWILTDGVEALSRYGEVQGSEAFKRVHVRPMPQPRISVSIDGGLLDLSVKTRDMSEDELLALLASYRLKKRWHRLKSGDYVDLRDAADLDALAETAQAMDTTIEDLIHGGVRIPKYRALYVDRLLEAHNDIATSRDRLFKALIRSFQTIRDSDFEAPEALTDVLRPYQLYGFRWLATLSQAGFGGILADEMGLGKTLQMLAYIRMQRERGEQKPALVVCPASLVYNWKDECHKFTPELRAETLAGTLRQRRALMQDMTADLYITSYDLIKRDITLYDGKAFSTIVLDEAQYVKNQKAAVSKVVRVLKGEHRFALTGTPIENRLSELWSIFDFLMPGFLYTSGEFGARFEGPIMKQKDAAAAEKLSRMTEPFILRRKKTDVLKDLPEKLEETRSSEMEEDQRKLYDAQLVRMKTLLQASGDSGEDKMRILAEITRLRQLCCDPSLLFADYKGTSAKRAACLELIQNAMDAGHRMLVFSQFTSMLALLQADLKAAKIPFYTLTGATPKQERIRLVNAFNEGDVPVFLISLKAGGTGLNLTGADVVIHYDPWWNLAVQNQATDRAHRIGQTRQVTVIRLIAADTIEERIVQLQETKRELADAIISGQNTSLMSLSKEELMELLG